jgi:hypothetical protein
VRKGTTTRVALTTAGAGALHVTLTWSPAGTVRLRLLGRSSATIAETTATGTSLTLDAPALAKGGYSLQLKLSGTGSVAFTLAASHC